jgi:sugar/nucleoside kinase (ribokinase family)
VKHLAEYRKKVVVAGHICLDITPVFSDNKIDSLDELLSPGKLICMKNADVHTGGAVANTGLSMKILGADVRLMGKVGKDAFGELVIKILNNYNASEGMIISDDSNTSYSIVLAPKGIDRIFLHSSGCNDTFSFDDLDFHVIQQSALFHFGYPPLMKKMYENGGKELVRIFKTVKACGVATSLDMAAVDSNSEAGEADWVRILENVLPYVDFFVPSFEELCFMIDRPKYQELMKRASGKDLTKVISVNYDVKPLADKLIEMRAKVVLIKCGALGIYYKTSGQEKMSTIGCSTERSFDDWVDIEGFEKSYRADKVLSGTGAGDTSIAAFLMAMLKGYSLIKCVQLASAEGTSCISAYDALSGLLSLDELNRKIENGWHKEIVEMEICSMFQ